MSQLLLSEINKVNEALKSLQKNNARKACRAAIVAGILLLTWTSPERAPARESASSAPASSPVLGLANCDWYLSPGARLSRQGNLLELSVASLPAPAPRTMTCWVSLSAPRGRVLSPQGWLVRGTHRGAVTEQGWTFAFEQPGGKPQQLFQNSQEGSFAFPVPTAWLKSRRLGVMIGIPGANPGYLRLEDLRLEAAPNALPAAPHLLAPREAESFTPAAADFFWSASPSEGATGYQLEWHRRRSNPKRLFVPAYFSTDALRASPPQWLAPGHYVWRVRASGALGGWGPWSQEGHFTVQAASSALPPDFTASSSQPLFLIDVEAEDPGPLWEKLPAEIRPHMLIRVGGSIPHIEQTLRLARSAGIPLALQVNGPHDIIAGRWDRLPLAHLSLWALDHPELKAFYICEQAVQGGIGNPEVADYLRRLIELGAETGRPVIWADANWGQNVWLAVEANPGFRAFLRAHRGYVYPTWKMNGGFVPYLAPAGLLGLWLDGTVSGWGVQPESWYWTEAGFGALGTQRDYKEGVREDAPPVLFQELALVGASAGASVYSFEPGTDFFNSSLGLSSKKMIADIFHPLVCLLARGAIPNRREVARAVMVRRTIQPADLIFRKGYTPALKTLFARTLGIAYPFEEIPQSGSCYWVPFIVSPSAENNSPGSNRKPCPPPMAGHAAIFQTGRVVFVFNSRVNWSDEQSFTFKLAGMRLSGSIGTGGWLVARAEPAHELRLWFFGRAPAPLRLGFDRPVVYAIAGLDNVNHGGVRPERCGQASLSLEFSSLPRRHLNLTATHRPLEILLRPVR